MNAPGATNALLVALKATSDACHAAPHRPESHYACGQAWSALGNHANAERAFAEALQLAPQWADAWINYGIARYRQGHIEDAKTAMRQPAISGTTVTIGRSGLPIGLESHLVVIDPGVEDWRTLVADLGLGARLVVLDPARDGVQAIAEAVAGRRDLSAIHIVSHGRAGEVCLGSAILSSASLDRHADALARIGGVLKAGGDILLYGCDVARGAAGQSFIAQLAQITGADVAAATHPVGACARGGSFDLDLRIGAIAPATPFAPRSLAAFNGLLNDGDGGSVLVNRAVFGLPSLGAINGGSGGTGLTGQAGGDGTNNDFGPGGGGGGGSGTTTGGAGGSGAASPYPGPAGGAGGVGAGGAGGNGTDGVVHSIINPQSLAAAGGGGGGVAGNGDTGTLSARSIGGAGGKGGNGASTYIAGGGGGGGAGGYGAIVTGSVTNTFGVTGGAGGNGGNGGNAVGVDPGFEHIGANGGNGGAGGVGLLVAGSGFTVTNNASINGGNGGTGGALGTATGGGANVPGSAGAAGSGGAGLVGANLAVVTSGGISGGLSGDGVTRANAITFTGGTNSLELWAGYGIAGNVVAASSADTLILGGTAQRAVFRTSGIGTQYSGFGVFNKTGTGIWLLTDVPGAATPWTISAGTLRAADFPHDNVFGSTSTITVNSPGTLDINGFEETIGALAGSGTVTNISDSFQSENGNAGFAPATLTAGGNGTSTIFSGVIQDGAFPTLSGIFNTYTGPTTFATALTKAGAGTLTLSGTNTYTGATTVSGGTLKAGSAGGFASGSAFTVNAALDLNGFNETIGSLAGSGTVTNSGVSAPATLAAGGEGASTIFSGVIQDSTSASALTKAGAGTLTLSGVNTYSGGTTIDSGTLELANGASAGTGAIAFNGPAATLQIDGTITNTIDAFAVGDVIDLHGLPFVAGATANYNSSTHILTVTSGIISETLMLTNPARTTFLSPTSDGHGTEVQLNPLQVSISGTVKEGSTLSAMPSIGDSDDTGATVSYQWQNSSDGSSWSNISGASSSTYALGEGDENTCLRVHASFTDDTGMLASADSAATPAKVVDNSSFSVSLSGMVKEGSTLTVTPTIGDADDTGTTVSYQWQNSTDGAHWGNISGATGSTYVVGEGDENKLVRVHASFTDDTSQLVSADSPASATEVVDNSSLSVAMIGPRRPGATLTATPTIGDPDDTGASVSYAWQISTDGSTWSNITGSTGSTYLAVQADDGKFVRVHASFTDDTSQLISTDSAAARIAIFESAPVVTPTSLASNIGHVNSVAASSLFTASDVDGVTQYDFWNTGAGGGQWMLNGVALGANQDNFVAAALLPLVAYLNGTGTDTLWVRANDGNQFGAWSQAFTATDTAPVVTPKSLSFTLSHDSTIATSTLFTASDADTDPIVTYDFWDTGMGGGHWLLNGTALPANQDNFVSAAQLAQVAYQSAAGTDTLTVRASDGLRFGDWTSAFTVTDTAPVTTAISAFVSSVANATFAVSSLFAVSDADGDTLTQYDVWNSGAGGGQWLLGGSPLATNTDNFLTPAQLAQVTYRDGSGGDTLWMRASDGLAFGSWSQVGVANGPTVIPATSALTASHLQTVAATSLFTASDADGDTLTQYDFWDTGMGGGRWLLDGSALTPNQDNILSASLLSHVSYRSGAGTDTLFVRASDGTFGPWSAPFTVTDTAPVTTAVNTSITPAVGQTLAPTSLFTVNDADTDTIAQYDVWDTGAGGGRWLVTGTPLGTNQDNLLTPAQFAALTYEAGTGGDTLWMRASDGLQFGAWSQRVTETNTLPVVTPISAAMLVSRAFTIAASRLFTAAESDGDVITQYDFWNTGVGDGQWLLNGVALAPNQDNFVAASQLETVSYRSGPGLDTLYVRASDGAGFGAWSQPLTATDSAPITTALHTIVSGAPSLTFAASSLFTASDPDQDSIAVYDVWSSGGGGGTWLLSGMPLATNSDNFILAGQLPDLTYQAGTSSDTIWMRASGLQFGDWSQAVTVVDAPVATPNNNAVLGVSGQTFTASTLFTAADADGDTITQFDLWDTGAGGGRWLLNGSPLPTNQDNVVSAAQLGQVTYKTGTGTDTLWVRASDGSSFGPWSNAFTVADPPAVPAASGANTNDPVTVAAGQTVEIGSAFSGSVTFAADTGTLKLDSSASFSGTVAGMTGQDALDLTDIDPSKAQHPSFSGDSSGGRLQVTDGGHSVNIALLGNYMASVFVAQSDGHGGTSVVDPPALGGVQPLVTPPHG